MLEQRFLKSTCELRQGPAGPMIFGYAAVFDRDSEDLGGFIEQIDPAAFTKTVREADVRGLGNHDENWLLGRSKPGTLRVRVDPAQGLYYEIDINTTDPDGQRARAKVERGDWDGSSFSFQCIRDEWDWRASPPRRRVLECALVDVGPVTFPAYNDTSVAARALERVARQLKKSPDELAIALRSGEIRSLLRMNGDDPAEPTGEETDTGTPDDAPPPDAPAVESHSLPDGCETRAGKTLSAATSTKIRQAMSPLQELLDASDQSTMGGLLPGESNSLRLRLAPALRTAARELEQREMPDMGGDADNLAAMTGAVASAYLAKRAELGLDVPENGFYLSPIADQDGDADGDGPTLFCVSDGAASWYVLADGDTANVVAWDGYEWASAWRSSPDEAESRRIIAEAVVRTREVDLLALASQ